MNGRFEEKLMQLAFGELSPEEAARVEAQASRDPEATRLLASYRGMQGGLKDLTDIPDDQLSKDRLRNAILMQGLKPKPEKASPWGWAWMPVAAGAIAVGLMMMNGRFGGSPEPIVAISDKAIDSGISPGLVASNLLGDFDFDKPEPVVKSAVVQTEEPKAKRKPRLSAPPEPDEYVPLDTEDLHKKSELFVAKTNNPSASTPSVIDDTGGSEAIATQPAPPIVIIEDNKDESTGAYRATEVGTASNVLIGG